MTARTLADLDQLATILGRALAKSDWTRVQAAIAAGFHASERARHPSHRRWARCSTLLNMLMGPARSTAQLEALRSEVLLLLVEVGP